MADMNLGGMKLNRTTIMISGAAAAGIIGYAYYRRKQNPPSSTSSSSTDTTGQSGTDPNIDPATGIPYADEYGGGGGGGYPYSGVGIYDPATGGTFGSGYGGQLIQNVTTNAAWAQAAELYLTSLGYDSVASSAAIGKALTGQYITPDQLQLFDTARAFIGEPPQTYPPLNTHPPGGQGGGSGGGGGGGGGGGNHVGAPTGVHVTRTTRNSISFSWSPVSGADGYHVYKNRVYAGRTTHPGATISGLSRNHTYDLSVKAYHAGTFGPATHISATTSR